MRRSLLQTVETALLSSLFLGKSDPPRSRSVAAPGRAARSQPDERRSRPRRIRSPAF